VATDGSGDVIGGESDEDDGEEHQDSEGEDSGARASTHKQRLGAAGSFFEKSVSELKASNEARDARLEAAAARQFERSKESEDRRADRFNSTLVDAFTQVGSALALALRGFGGQTPAPALAAAPPPQPPAAALAAAPPPQPPAVEVKIKEEPTWGGLREKKRKRDSQKIEDGCDLTGSSPEKLVATKDAKGNQVNAIDLP
jgi:hypothetical protein